jgi:hypothetical protein
MKLHTIYAQVQVIKKIGIAFGNDNDKVGQVIYIYLTLVYNLC